MKSFSWLKKGVKTYPWFALLILNLLLCLWPQSYGTLRMFHVASAIVLWLWGAFILRKRKAIAIGVLVAGILPLLFLCLPGSKSDPEKLRAAYVRSLESYEGTVYVWGGETRLGIDCSGLVRNGLIKANLWTGLKTLNPLPVRKAFTMWWYDCSAKALSEEYRDFTTLLASYEGINAIPSTALLPGDIAVTTDGVHVLAYLGDDEWIQADPGPMKTVITETPSDDYYFTVPVHVMRWTQLRVPETTATRDEVRLPRFKTVSTEAVTIDWLAFFEAESKDDESPSPEQLIEEGMRSDPIERKLEMERELDRAFPAPNTLCR